MRNFIIIITLFCAQACTATSLTVGSDKFLAEEHTKSMHCTNSQNIDQSLNRLIKTKNLQDRGWQVFSGDDGYTVERIVSVNKITDIHYRWRVNHSGTVQPANEKADSLCAS
jgi:hypothetical protein